MNPAQTAIDPRKPLFKKAEYARLWDVSLRTVDAWISAGVVRFVRRGHVVRIVNDLVEREEAERAEGGAEVPW